MGVSPASLLPADRRRIGESQSASTAARPTAKNFGEGDVGGAACHSASRAIGCSCDGADRQYAARWQVPPPARGLVPRRGESPSRSSSGSFLVESHANSGIDNAPSERRSAGRLTCILHPHPPPYPILRRPSRRQAIRRLPPAGATAPYYIVPQCRLPPCLHRSPEQPILFGQVAARSAPESGAGIRAVAAFFFGARRAWFCSLSGKDLLHRPRRIFKGRGMGFPVGFEATMRKCVATCMESDSPLAELATQLDQLAQDGWGDGDIRQLDLQVRRFLAVLADEKPID